MWWCWIQAASLLYLQVSQIRQFKNIPPRLPIPSALPVKQEKNEFLSHSSEAKECWTMTPLSCSNKDFPERTHCFTTELCFLRGETDLSRIVPFNISSEAALGCELLMRIGHLPWTLGFYKGMLISVER